MRDGADRHRLAVGQRLETGTPGNGRARRHSGRATIALQPRSWRTEIDLTCCYQRGAAEPPSDRYELVAHGADGATYDLGSWRLAPGRRVIFASGTALTESQIKNLQITQPNGPAIVALRVPGHSRTADR